MDVFVHFSLPGRDLGQVGMALRSIYAIPSSFSIE